MTGIAQMLRPEDVAEILGVTRATTFKLPIPYYKLGKRTYRWKLDDVQAYIDSRPRKIDLLEKDQIVAKAMSAPVMPGIYFLLFRGEVVYVGQSICPLRRLGDHSSDKGKHFDAYVCIPHDIRDLANAEYLYIQMFRPKYNKVGWIRDEFEDVER